MIVLVNVAGDDGRPDDDPVAAQVQVLVAALVRQRTAAGVTQGHVAAWTGMSQATVCRLESGRREIRVSDLVRYAGAVGLSVGLTVAVAEAPPGHVPSASDSRRRQVPRGAGEPDPRLSLIQRRVIEAIIELTGKQDRPPSLEEIGAAVGRSTSSVHYQLGELARKGYVQRARGEARGLWVLRTPPLVPGTALVPAPRREPG